MQEHPLLKFAEECHRQLPRARQLLLLRGEWGAARRGFGYAILARFFYTILGVVTLVAYEALVFGWPVVMRYVLPWTVALAVSMLAGGVAAAWLARRSLRLFLAPDESEAEFLVDDALRREILNLPIYLALVDLTLWVTAGSVLAAITLAGSPGEEARVLIHGFVSSIYAGELVAMMEFYAMERLLGKHLVPFVMQGKRVSEISGIRAVPVWLRILMLVLTTSVFPMLFLFMLHGVGDAKGPILLFMITLTLVNGAWQGFHVVLSVSGTIGKLAGVFDRFRRNQDESERARIYRADALGRFAEMFEELVSTIEERDFIRGTFGRYVSQQVADEILNGRVELGGTLQTATVLFADIRGFTSLSERLRPSEVVDLLNEYLEDMVQAITAHEGIPDKFIGDGILAVWGVPLPCERHQEKAVRTALDMLQKIEALNVRRRNAGAEPIRIGIGVHAGELIAGNIGSKKKMEFTVIGDTVNTCSRIESANKELGTALAISAAVFEALTPELQSEFAAAPPQKLRGKDAALALFVHKVRNPLIT